jgi:uncharacterized protein YtpQ (UPF0354 family)
MCPSDLRKSCAAALLLLASAATLACDVPPGVAADRIVPLVRNRAFVEGARELKGQVLPVRWLNSELAVVFAENTLVQVKYFRVAPEQATCWEGHAALHDALRNVTRTMKPMQVFDPTPGITLLSIGGALESSLILAPQVLRQAVQGRLDTMLVGIPNRHTLFIADPQNTQAVQALRQAVGEAFAKGSNPISARLFLVSSCELSVVPDDAVPAPKPCN